MADASPVDAGSPLDLRPSFFVSAYYTSFSSGMIPLGAVDFGAMTHVHAFGVTPAVDGGLAGSVSPGIVASAHAARRPVLLTVGGRSSQAAFEGAIGPTRRAAFVAAIAALVVADDFDGVDLDMEPLSPADDTDFAAFVVALRAALPPAALLTSTLEWEEPLFASLQGSFDRLQLLSYHLLGDEDVTWHNAALYTPPGDASEPLDSVDAEVTRALAVGIAPAKVSLGIDFSGVEWSGASAPEQDGKGLNAVSLTYAQIVDQLFAPEAYRWDPVAAVPYLSLTGDASATFVSYDDVSSVARKVDYAFSRHLGGVMVWNLAADYLSSAPTSGQTPLMASVKAAVAGNTTGPAYAPDAATGP